MILSVHYILHCCVFLDRNESSFGCRQGRWIIVKYYLVMLNDIYTRGSLPLLIRHLYEYDKIDKQFCSNISIFLLYKMCFSTISCRWLLISVGHKDEVYCNWATVPVVMWLERSSLGYPQVFCLRLCELTEVSIK